MVQVEVSTVIDRPIEDVFRFVEDEHNLPRWDDDLIKATKTSDGPIGTGTRFHLDIKPFMGTTEGEGEVVDHQPNDVIELRFDMGKMKTHVHHLFDVQGKSTRFTRRVEVQPEGFLKMMQPLMKGMIQKRNVAYLAKLKSLIESES